MKNINFINSPSPYNQHDASRWFLVSLVAISTTTVVICFKQTEQVYRLLKSQSLCSSTEQQCCTSNEYLNNHHSYAEQLRTITQKLNLLLTVQSSLARVAMCMQDISHSTHSSTLEHCSIKENMAKLSLHIPQKKHIQLLTHAISNTKWAHQVLLESINTAQSDGALITINISLKA